MAKPYDDSLKYLVRANLRAFVLALDDEDDNLLQMSFHQKKV